MKRKSLLMQTLVACLFLLSGCDVFQSARNDLNRLVSSDPFKSSPPPRQTAARTAAPPTAKPAASSQTAAAAPSPPSSPATGPVVPDTKPDPSKDASEQPSINLIGKSEAEVRALFGPPTTVEERAPGKTWRYRDGKCTLDVQLYPDVQTRQFATLAYEVKSDDSTDEGNRACLGQLRSRGQSR